MNFTLSLNISIENLNSDNFSFNLFISGTNSPKFTVL